VRPDDKKAIVEFMVEEHGVSHRQACLAVSLPRSSYQYKAKERDDSQLIQQLQQLVEKYPSIGFWQCFYRIRRMGHHYNHKRVYRVYTALQFNIRRRLKKRLPARVKQALFQPERINQVWSVDFMSDSLWDGRKFRLLNIVDDYNREILSMEADLSIPALRLIRVLEYLKEFRGLPEMIRVDNGPEFISHKLEAWCKENKVQLVFISCSSSLTSLCRMPMSSAATAASEESCSTLTCLEPYPRFGRRPRHGCLTTTIIGPIRR
jgi:putative transposase